MISLALTIRYSCLRYCCESAMLHSINGEPLYKHEIQVLQLHHVYVIWELLLILNFNFKKMKDKVVEYKGIISRNGNGKGIISRNGNGKWIISRNGNGKGIISRNGNVKGIISRNGNEKGIISRNVNGKWIISRNGNGKWIISRNGNGKWIISRNGNRKEIIPLDGNGKGIISRNGNGKGMIERKEGREYDGRGNGTERDLCNDEFYGGWGGVGCGKGIYIYLHYTKTNC